MNAQQIGELAAGVLHSVSGTAKTSSFYDMAMGFIHAVDWTEPWIIALLSFHVLVFLVRALLAGYRSGFGGSTWLCD